tara:strand:+ start:326 stop:1171 length:846 start_codon:yes stop_codon:yes gene_type:complete
MGIKKISKSIIVVPARLDSSRLPKKVLADIKGKPMLIRVLEQCKKASGPSEVILSTDSNELSILASNIGIHSLITEKLCNSGSERIASVMRELMEIAWKEKFSEINKPDSIFQKKLKQTLIINVQGDQPFLDPNVITRMYEYFSTSNELPEVVTPIYKLKKKDIHNEAVVKTLLNQKNEAIYFSRTPLPFVRDKDKSSWHLHYDYWGHVGIYGYRADILFNWFNYPISALEKCEKLEQLKLIDAGIKISTFVVKGDFISIDTAEQLEDARNLNDEYLPIVR